ncbi:MAG TPA: Crp/Fnr family transcriptional regulator [Terriglobia bacterium]|nr:Crp/Fnr family transcriptional regulator [Terriglobia bacterium]
MPTAEHDHRFGRQSGSSYYGRPGPDGNHCVVAVDRPRLFAGIDPPVYEEICRLGRTHQFLRGEVLHLESDPVRRVIMLTSGSVKLTKVGRTGNEVILRLVGVGDFLGTEGLLDCGRYCATAQVFHPCAALIWDVQVLSRALDRHPIVRQNLMAILEEHLREMEDRFREVATERVGARLALQLMRLMKSVGRPVSSGIEIAVSREDLAQMTGTTLFTVSRFLSAWECRGTVKARRNAVEICDVNSLCHLCEEAPE